MRLSMTSWSLGTRLILLRVPSADRSAAVTAEVAVLSLLDGEID